MQASSSEWRLIRSGPGTAAWNMAVDEALLESFQAGDPPLLRLYQWDPAAISLGRFQPAASVELPPGRDLVRRLSGGAAIHHQPGDVTYAVVASYALFGRKPRRAYEAIHALIRAALTRLGVQANKSETEGSKAPLEGMCFEQPTSSDLVVSGGRKLVGSAQRRLRDRFLQHGSLPLHPDPLSPGAAALSELLPNSVAEDVEEAICKALLSSLAASIRPAPLSERERALAEELVSRHQSKAWQHAR